MARKIAVCFFGITRSLAHTLPELKANVIEPAQEAGDARLFAHLFLQRRIDNPRSGEQGQLNPEEYRLLNVPEPELEEPGACLAAHGIEELKPYGDSWDDGFRSLGNLVHQLHSLERVTAQALDWGAEVAVFARPDLRYHDSLKRVIRAGIRAPGPLVQLPRWQPHEGMNDRFAVVTGRQAISAYGGRIGEALNFCRDSGRPLNGERLVKYVIEKNGFPVRPFAARASRVRADGSERWEEFSRPEIARLKASLRPKLTRVADRIGLRELGRAAQRALRP